MSSSFEYFMISGFTSIKFAHSLMLGAAAHSPPSVDKRLNKVYWAVHQFNLQAGCQLFLETWRQYETEPMRTPLSAFYHTGIAITILTIADKIPPQGTKGHHRRNNLLAAASKAWEQQLYPQVFSNGSCGDGIFFSPSAGSVSFLAHGPTCGIESGQHLKIGIELAEMRECSHHLSCKGSV